MNELNTIIANSKFDSNKLYLLEKVGQKFGFFYSNNTVYFGTKSSDLGLSSLSTNYLELDFNITINSIITNQTFESGKYDLLKFKGDLNTSLFDIFYSLCKKYCSDDNGMSLFDFFNTIRNLFEKTKDNDFRNCIGILGELYLIKYLFTNYKTNIADAYHLAGSNSKFDFSFDTFNIEVKATSKIEKIFLLKHSQIFNNQHNYICVINFIETGTDLSINKLLNYFNNEDSFKNNLRFQTAILTEINKIKNPNELDKGFSLQDISIFDTRKLPSLDNIPSNISEIEYKYNFSGEQPDSFENIFKIGSNDE